MISTLINLLGGFYESNDFTKVETIARNIHRAIPGDQVSLKFLGLAYYRTGRIRDAIRLFDQVERAQQANLSADPRRSGTKRSAVESAAKACSQEAARRVPYLAQAWRELGNSLRKFDRSCQSLHIAQMA